jgi:hypothetical protein
MSYDLIVAEKAPGEDWATVLSRIEAAPGPGGTLSETRRGVWERVAARLLTIDGQFERFDAPAFIEVSHETLGIQVSMFEQEASVSVPFWHEGGASHSVMLVVGQIVEVVRELSGWSVWDPQLGQELESQDALVTAGAPLMSDTAESLTEIVAERRRPWWKFWRR